MPVASWVGVPLASIPESPLAQIPPSMRASRRELDLRLIQRASDRIAEINTSLDLAVAAERSEAERMRLLREATNQIVRLANDSAQAYRRATRAIKLDIDAGRGTSGDHERMRLLLQSARAALLAELEAASRRYPWADPWGAAADETASSPTSA
jgi:hypothetical protein